MRSRTSSQGRSARRIRSAFSDRRSRSAWCCRARSAASRRSRRRHLVGRVLCIPSDRAVTTECSAAAARRFVLRLIDVTLSGSRKGKGRHERRTECESKIKDGGILGSRGASSGIRRSIGVAADESSASTRGLRGRGGAPSAGGSDAASDPVAPADSPPQQCSPRSRLGVAGASFSAAEQPADGAPDGAWWRSICRGSAAQAVLRCAVDRSGRDPFRKAPVGPRCRSDGVRPRSDDLRVQRRKGRSRAVGHSGPHESRWAKDSSMIPVDSRRMARLYLAFASFCSRIFLLDAASRASPRSSHRPRLCRCSAHPFVPTDAFDLLQEGSAAPQSLPAFGSCDDLAVRAFSVPRPRSRSCRRAVRARKGNAPPRNSQ